MGQAEYKIKGGKLVRVKVAKIGDKIEKIKITGDFFLHPEETIEQIEKALVGEKIDSSILTSLITGLLRKNNATMLGASPEDFAKCILMAGESID